jgi:polyhydroxybutyrate depolymerase
MKRWPSLALVGALLGCSEPDASGLEGGVTEGDDTSSDDPTTGPPFECMVTDPLPPGDYEHTLEHDGQARTYLLHVPESIDADVAAPLVLNMHGYLSSPQMQAQWSQLVATAGPRGWIVAHPTGASNSWNGGACCGDAASTDLDDVGFLKAVVDDIAGMACVDPRRVHATGLSNGGYMSHRLACEASDVFASVAPVVASLGFPDCAPPRPVSVLAFNGVQDGLVAYEDAAASMRIWAEIDGCEPVPEREDFDGGHVEVWHGCADATSVELYTLDPMGHCWPGGDASQCLAFLGPHSDAVDANTVMLDFFDEHRL